MESSELVLLLIGIYCLTHTRLAHAECCTSSEQVSFGMENGSCNMFGGIAHDGVCEVTICADGVVMKGAYCGRGPCNIFGCNCDGGCLTGEWSKSFREKNHHLGIKIVETSRSPF